MEISFRKGTPQDVPYIMNIIQDTVEIMERNHNDQWTEDYPKEENFLKDINRGKLYVAVNEKDKPVGTVTVEEEGPKQYQTIPWRKEDSAYYIHRIAVDVQTRGQGVASKLLQYAEEVAKQDGINYLKTDTYSLNKKAQSMFTKNGYKEVGVIPPEEGYLGKEEPFFVYDKILH